jgi:hypothetical protein
MSPLAATARSLGWSNDGPPTGAWLRDRVVRTPVAGSTRITPPLPLAKALVSAIRILPLASTAIPYGPTRSGPLFGAVLLDTSVRAPVVRFTRTTDGVATPLMSLSNGSATSRSPAASTVIPIGDCRLGPPTGVLLSDSNVRPPDDPLTLSTMPFSHQLGGEWSVTYNWVGPSSVELPGPGMGSTSVAPADPGTSTTANATAATRIDPPALALLTSIRLTASPLRLADRAADTGVHGRRVSPRFDADQGNVSGGVTVTTPQADHQMEPSADR